MTIDSGGSVEWTNLDGIEHSVDFDDFGSGLLFEGDSFLHVFDDPGGFDYICGIHPWMTGTVTAVAVSGAPTAAATATPASALRARGHSARQALRGAHGQATFNPGQTRRPITWRCEAIGATSGLSV